MLCLNIIIHLCHLRIGDFACFWFCYWVNRLYTYAFTKLKWNCIWLSWPMLCHSLLLDHGSHTPTFHPCCHAASVWIWNLLLTYLSPYLYFQVFLSLLLCAVLVKQCCHCVHSILVFFACSFWLVCRISDLFDHNELDAIKDRKDKFKRFFWVFFHI